MHRSLLKLTSRPAIRLVCVVCVCVSEHMLMYSHFLFSRNVMLMMVSTIASHHHPTIGISQKKHKEKSKKQQKSSRRKESMEKECCRKVGCATA